MFTQHMDGDGDNNVTETEYIDFWLEAVSICTVYSNYIVLILILIVHPSLFCIEQ